jgi:hypothetical protein
MGLGNRSLKPARGVPVARVSQNFLNRSRQIFLVHRGDRHRFTHPMVDNSGRNARLVEAYRNRHDWHTERERFERCVDAGMGNTQLGSFEQFYLGALETTMALAGIGPRSIHLNIAAYREDQLSSRNRGRRLQNDAENIC